MSSRFDRRWILANAWGEGLGIGVTLLLGVLAGAVVGAVHGRFLMRMLPASIQVNGGAS